MTGEETTNIRQEYNNATSGLNLDQSVNQIPKGKLTYALNASVENFDSDSVNYQNEPGNELCLDFPTNFHLIGTHFIVEKNKHVFFLANPETGDSQIGYMDNNDCVYRVAVSAPCLNFDINYPILKAVHKITNCTTEVYWTDGLNPRRYIDLNNIPYKLAPTADLCDPVYTNELDCNQLNVQPNFNIPSLDITDVVTGGDLTAGTYQFAIQYSDAAGNAYTSYYSVTNPTPIANPNITTPEFSYQVGNSIVVSISNLDTSGQFQYFNLAVIKTVNAIASVELVGTYFIEDDTRTITYTGQNVTQIRLAIADIFEKYPYYEVAQDLTTAQDILIWDNLTSIDRINYQQIATQIDLKWETYRIPSTETYADELNATNLRGYLRDEVYAFEIVFLLSNGKQTDGFHIPGRMISANEGSQPDVPSSNPDFIGEGTIAPYWKIYNTGSVTGFSPGYTTSQSYKGPYQYGEFAYWESTDTYPCNIDVWGTLASQPIRHHKFPDVLVSPIFESPTYTLGSGFTPVMQSDAVFPMGVKIDVQQVAYLVYSSNLTQAQKESIVGFKIVRGDRSTNRSIVGKGILRNVGKYKREETEFYFPNYPYNDLNKDEFLLDNNNGYCDECITYKLVTTGSTIVEYTDCFSNTLISETLVSSPTNIFSLSTPIITSGTAVVTIVPYDTYRLTSNSTTTFESKDPLTGNTVVTIVNVGVVEFVNSTTIPTIIGGTSDATITKLSTRRSLKYPNKLDAFATDESKYRMVFNSPETSFGQPFLGTVLKLENVMFGAGIAHFVEVKKNAMYKLLTAEAQNDALKSSEAIAAITPTFNASAMFAAYQAYLTIYINGITRRNYGYSFNSIASYDYSGAIDNNLGIKQRQLDNSQYLFSGVQSVSDLHDFNNFNRESSIYIKTVDTRDGSSVIPLPFPNQTPSLLVGGVSGISDTSRFTVSQKNNCSVPNKNESINVVSYYGSLKNIFVNQWGQIYSYETIDTGFQENIDINNLMFSTPKSATIFGGDTFINKFAFKTKLPFFIDNRVNAPDDSDIFYDEIGNVAYPQYWHSARSILQDYSLNAGAGPVLKNMISYKAHNFDCPNNQNPAPNSATNPPIVNPNRTFYDGKMYMFAYGIPYFYCESSYNVDLRQAFNNLEGDFYPHVSSGIPDNWLQESVVPIVFDNTYYYNITYSKQNRENVFTHLPADWVEELCYTKYPFRAVYSDPQDAYADNKVNSWLTYSATSFFDFPQNFGDLVSLDGIQNKAILARFENKSLLYNTMLTVQTSNPQAAYLGNDTLFKSAPPIDFAETDLGYVGSQNKMLLKIPQGQITVDAKRGQVFLIEGLQATDLSGFGSGLNKFFTDHLAFEILRYYPDVNTDNHYNGIGLHGVFDSKYDRVIISKLDYIPNSKDIKYDAIAREFYIERVLGGSTLRTVVSVYDSEYFCNKSWTLSFSMNTKSWISFHSYIPNFYIAENNFFYSGLNGGCDLEAIAFSEIPCTTTTTTSTTKDCRIIGTAVDLCVDCTIVGTAVDTCCMIGTAVEVCTTTTTTTNLFIWYQLTNCEDSSIEYSESYPFGTFAINDRVTSPGNTWVVTGSLTIDPGGVLYAITPTGFTDCPGSTTTTTTSSSTTTTTTTAAPPEPTTTTTTSSSTSTTTTTTTADPTPTTTTTTTIEPTTTTTTSTSTSTTTSTSTSTTTTTTTTAPPAPSCELGGTAEEECPS